MSVTEAVARLYFNNLLNFDLSEQEAACCNGTLNPWKGMGLERPLLYIKEHGVCDEDAYPFVNSESAAICRSSEVIPNELIKIGGYTKIENDENKMKEALIKYGPLSSAVFFWGYNQDKSKYSKHHAMSIVGYGRLQVGDTIFHWIESDGFGNGNYTVPEGDPHVGMTYWIYKNSYGQILDEARNGYRYIIHHNYNKSVTGVYAVLPEIYSMNYSDEDIVCEDTDGDGYYYWGIGAKPSWCPEWVPNVKDGDDSDPSKGKLLLEETSLIGDLEYIAPNDTPLQITGNTTYYTRQAINSHIRIAPNAVLTVPNILNLFGHVTITIEAGGELLIDGGIITNAHIEIASGGRLTITNGGKLILRTNTDFMAPSGAIVEISEGKICNSTDF